MLSLNHITVKIAESFRRMILLRTEKKKIGPPKSLC